MKTTHKTLIGISTVLFLGTLGPGIYYYVDGKNNKDLSDDKKTKHKRIGFWLLVASAIVFGLFLSPTVAHALCSHSFNFVNPMKYFRRHKNVELSAPVTNPVSTNVGSNLRSNVGSNLRSNVGSNVGSNLHSNVGSNLHSNLSNSFKRKLY